MAMQIHEGTEAIREAGGDLVLTQVKHLTAAMTQVLARVSELEQHGRELRRVALLWTQGSA